MKTILVALLACAPLFAQATAPRSIWVWEQTTRDMLRSEAQANQLFDVASANSIETLYVYADYYSGINDVTDNPGLYQNFLSNAHARGFQVHALLGSMYLNTNAYFLPLLRPFALAMISNVLDYNGVSAANERFDGFNVDIEPHVTFEWSINQPAASHYYLDMLSEQMALITTSGQDMVLGPAIPRWYDTNSNLVIEYNGNTKPLSEHIQDITDYIAIMDYVSDPISIANGARNELIYGEQIGKPVTVGIEIGDFAPYTNEQMEIVLAYAEDRMDDYSSYDGIVIHHYDSYLNKLGLAMIPEPSTISFAVFLSVVSLIMGRHRRIRT